MRCEMEYLYITATVGNMVNNKKNIIFSLHEHKDCFNKNVTTYRAVSYENFIELIEYHENKSFDFCIKNHNQLLKVLSLVKEKNNDNYSDLLNPKLKTNKIKKPLEWFCHDYFIDWFSVGYTYKRKNNPTAKAEHKFSISMNFDHSKIEFMMKEFFENFNGEGEIKVNWVKSGVKNPPEKVNKWFKSLAGKKYKFNSYSKIMGENHG